MNREQAQVIWPVMKAFGENQIIEYKTPTGRWLVASNPTWNTETTYRVRVQSPEQPQNSTALNEDNYSLPPEEEQQIVENCVDIYTERLPEDCGKAGYNVMVTDLDKLKIRVALLEEKASNHKDCIIELQKLYKWLTETWNNMCFSFRRVSANDAM